MYFCEYPGYRITYRRRSDTTFSDGTLLTAAQAGPSILYSFDVSVNSPMDSVAGVSIPPFNYPPILPGWYYIVNVAAFNPVGPGPISSTMTIVVKDAGTLLPVRFSCLQHPARHPQTCLCK
jgi:hypothetical protein